jgi:Flp pilus assembly protein TadB
MITVSEGTFVSLDPDKMKTIIAFKKRLEDKLEALSAETKEVP